MEEARVFELENCLLFMTARKKTKVFRKYRQSINRIASLQPLFMDFGMSSVTVMKAMAVYWQLSHSPFLIYIKLPFWQTLSSRISISYPTFYVAEREISAHYARGLINQDFIGRALTFYCVGL